MTVVAIVCCRWRTSQTCRYGFGPGLRGHVLCGSCVEQALLLVLTVGWQKRMELKQDGEDHCADILGGSGRGKIRGKERVELNDLCSNPLRTRYDRVVMNARTCLSSLATIIIVFPSTLCLVPSIPSNTVTESHLS
jgi:hypothetical protein